VPFTEKFEIAGKKGCKLITALLNPDISLSLAVGAGFDEGADP
jgi:hypothetical protein